MFCREELFGTPINQDIRLSGFGNALFFADENCFELLFGEGGDVDRVFEYPTNHPKIFVV